VIAGVFPSRRCCTPWTNCVSNASLHARLYFGPGAGGRGPAAVRPRPGWAAARRGSDSVTSLSQGPLPLGRLPRHAETRSSVSLIMIQGRVHRDRGGLHHDRMPVSRPRARAANRTPAVSAAALPFK
jgi:hypothetical protein